MAFWLVLAIIFILLLFATITLLQSVRMELEYWREGTDDHLMVYLSGPYGIVFQRFEVPGTDLIPTGAGPALSHSQESQDALGGKQHTTRNEILFTEIRKIRAIWRKLRPVWQTYRPATDYLLRHVRLEALTWETRLGVNDAAATGLWVGTIWALKGAVITFLQSRFPVDERKCSITVSPYFNHEYFSTFFHCIFTIRLVHVMNVQLKLLGYKLRQRKR